MFGTVAAIDYDVPPGSSVMTARFNVMEGVSSGGAEFSMISEDGNLIIHIHESTLVYFEGFVPLSDAYDAGQTQMVREMLFDRTLAEVLDGRNLTVTYAITTMSIPPQTSPISVMVLFEEAVHLADAGFINALQFDDVNSDDWFYNAVTWVFNNGIMNGISETEFAPEGDVTRAMFVTALWRYAGEPAAEAAAFADVAAGMWYSEAIAWAAENGIVTGLDLTAFAPYNNLTREQMYTILYRYMNFAGINIQVESEMRLNQFADEVLVSDWALDAMHFMFDAGIMFVYSSIDFYARPQQTTFRGEVAAAIYFFNRHATTVLDVEVIIERTDVFFDSEAIFENPILITSMDELEAYMSLFNEFADTTAFEAYDNEFFTDNYLLIVCFEETSGSNRHRVDAVLANGEIHVTRFLAETGTADMAGWHILIEIDKNMAPTQFNLVSTYENV